MANLAIAAPIIGASRPEQLDAADLKLDDDLRRQLDERTHQYRTGDAPRSTHL